MWIEISARLRCASFETMTWASIAVLKYLSRMEPRLAFDVTPQCLADFGLLARYTELHGCQLPLAGRVRLPEIKDVGTRPCPIKHCTTASVRSSR